eukprot:TRINITY_DN2849_c1_g1_i1.p1 TRINITY_DN2849_c1_g1~~TRINITY_DN2849_c1_g1_i1.p1  ORF type:complete len:192 (-),score=46.13 TRINITY_DN2849_c1_g1_i1:681-1211(-)
MEDIVILRDVLREVCKRLTRIEAEERRQTEGDEEFYSCEEESGIEGREEEEEEGTGGLQRNDTTGMADSRNQEDKGWEGPEPLLDSKESTEEMDQSEELSEDLQLSDEELDEEERDLLPSYPFSRKNPGPYSIKFIVEVLKKSRDKWYEKSRRLEEETERLRDFEYFRRKFGVGDF